MDSLWCAHTTDSMKRLMFRQYYICLKRSIAWRLNGWRPPFSRYLRTGLWNWGQSLKFKRLEHFPVFLSMVFVVRNQSTQLERILSEAARRIALLVSDYELIIVDNASDDGSVSILKHLTGDNGIPNLQVYALTKEVDADTATWVGLENALGDFIGVIDPLMEDIAFLPDMLDQAVSGADAVL